MPARVCLDLPNSQDGCFERGSKVLMDFSRIAAFDKESLITVSGEKVMDVFVGLPSPDRWTGRDLPGNLLALVNAEAADNDVRPFFGKRQRSGFADAGGASRDKDSLLFESCHTHSFSSFQDFG